MGEEGEQQSQRRAKKGRGTTTMYTTSAEENETTTKRKSQKQETDELLAKYFSGMQTFFTSQTKDLRPSPFPLYYYLSSTVD